MYTSQGNAEGVMSEVISELREWFPTGKLTDGQINVYIEVLDEDIDEED